MILMNMPRIKDETKRVQIKELLINKVGVRRICKILQVGPKMVEEVKKEIQTEQINQPKKYMSTLEQKFLTIIHESKNPIIQEIDLPRMNEWLISNFLTEKEKEILRPFKEKYAVLYQLFDLLKTQWVLDDRGSTLPLKEYQRIKDQEDESFLEKVRMLIDS